MNSLFSYYIFFLLLWHSYFLICNNIMLEQFVLTQEIPELKLLVFQKHYICRIIIIYSLFTLTGQRN